MSKFLSKLWVMITLVAVSTVLLGVYIYALARPISYGMWYSYSHVEKVSEDQSVTIEMSYKFINDKKLVAKVSSGGTVAETEMWYINNGKQVFFLTDDATLTMNEETFDAMVEQLKAEEAEWNALWSGEADPGMGIAYNMSAFNMKANVAGIEQADQNNLVCGGAIAFAVIMGIIEIALITFAVLSVIYYIKGKKVVVTTASEEKVEEVVVTEEKKEE